MNNNNNQNQSEQSKIYIGVQYIPNLTENKELKSLINQERIKFAHRPTETINNLFTKTKDPTPKSNQNNVVYEVQCAGDDNGNCNNTYIGTTKRALKIRIAEHKADIDNEKTATALSQHMMTHKHTANFEQVRILDRERNNNKRLTLESLRIQQKIETAMNSKEDKDKISLVYSVIL